MNLATIDIGTNTTLLLVVESGRDLTVLAERAEITRLGRGIGQPSAGGAAALGAEAMARTLDVLRDYAAVARAHGAMIHAVGTEALRRAANAAAFLEPAARILGTPVEVIDGAREAALSFRAVTASFPAQAQQGPLIVVDIGGGSTEIVISERGTVRFHVSLPLGSVRLTERHLAAGTERATAAELDRLDAEVAQALAAVPFPGGAATLVGVAGTVTSLAAMAQRLESYDPTRVHGFGLSLAALEAEVTRLAASSQPERQLMVGLDPRRADVISAGARILLAIARAAGVSEVLVSDRGIRWGLMYEVLERPAAA